LAFLAGAFGRSAGDGLYSWIADFDGSGTTDYTDVAYFAGNFQQGNTTPTPVVFPPNFPDVFRGQPLRLDAQPSAKSNAAALTGELLAPLVNEAVARIERKEGERAVASISEVTVEIVDLPGNLLGRAHNDSVIQIDVDAAGYGWFVDSTPWDDVEFAPSDGTYETAAWPGSPASDRADLLSVILHELGHVLGYDHSDNGSVMDESLPLGTRRVWDDGSVLEDATDFGDALAAPGLTSGMVDDYFATKQPSW
jgi:hypothetical protein